MDPGIISSDYYLENYEIGKKKIKNYNICRKCNIVMDLDKRVEHCTYCNICIFGNDHHCPWTSKCVGEKNIIMFRAFVVSLILQFISLFINSILISIYIKQIKKIKNNK